MLLGLIVLEYHSFVFLVSEVVFCKTGQSIGLGTDEQRDYPGFVSKVGERRYK